MAKQRRQAVPAGAKKKAKWPWVVGGLLALGVIGNMGDPEQTATTETVQVEQVTTTTPAETPVQSEAEAAAPPTESPAAETISGPALFEEKTGLYFSPSYTESASMDEAGAGVVIFKQDPEYLETGDKINKIFAIESARLFREVPDLNGLTMTVPATDGEHRINLTRVDLEQHYGVALNNEMDWEAFLQAHDNKESRAAVVEQFGTTPAPAASVQSLMSAPVAEPAPQGAPPAETLSFGSCAEAAAAGYSHMRQGEPGYSANLDRDDDGIACDK